MSEWSNELDDRVTRTEQVATTLLWGGIVFYLISWVMFIVMLESSEVDFEGRLDSNSFLTWLARLASWGISTLLMIITFAIQPGIICRFVAWLSFAWSCILTGSFLGIVWDNASPAVCFSIYSTSLFFLAMRTEYLVSLDRLMREQYRRFRARIAFQREQPFSSSQGR